jgi:hypothetical protein
MLGDDPVAGWVHRLREEAADAVAIFLTESQLRGDATVRLCWASSESWRGRPTGSR